MTSDGMAAGTAMRETYVQRPSPRLRASSSASAVTWRKPFNAFRKTGKNEARRMMLICVGLPIPSHRISNGVSASGGIMRSRASGAAVSSSTVR